MLKNILKHIDKIISIIIGAVLVATVHHLKEENKELDQLLAYQTAEAKTWKDKYGQEHIEKMALQADKDTFDKLVGDEVAEDTGLKNPQSVTKVSTVTSNKVKANIQPDSTISHKDPYFELAGRMTGNNTLTLDYTVYDSLTFITYYDRNLLKPSVYKVQAISSNPNTSFKSINHVEIKEKTRRIGLGVGVYMGIDGRPLVGIGLQYNLIRF